jgi:hypothetical protein
MDGDSDPDRADRERQHDAEHQDQPPAQLAWLPLAAIHEPEDERDRDEADEEQCEARVDVAGHGLRVRPIDVPGLGHPDSGHRCDPAGDDQPEQLAAASAHVAMIRALFSERRSVY